MVAMGHRHRKDQTWAPLVQHRMVRMPNCRQAAPNCKGAAEELFDPVKSGRLPLWTFAFQLRLDGGGQPCTCSIDWRYHSCTRRAARHRGQGRQGARIVA